MHILERLNEVTERHTWHELQAHTLWPHLCAQIVKQCVLASALFSRWLLWSMPVPVYVVRWWVTPTASIHAL